MRQSVIELRPFKKEGFEAISSIYAEGITTGIATFETKVPDWSTWDKKYIDTCRIVATIEDKIVGFAVLSQASKRKVYEGVAEVSVYVDNMYKSKGVGEKLLNQLISESEASGFWTLQAGIFSENQASINLHKKCGFRIVGVRKKIGKLNGKWYDNHFLERRSKNIN
jgi:phosphinothricin acetyltransferase